MAMDSIDQALAPKRPALILGIATQSRPSNLAAVDLDQIDARHALCALPAFWALLDEGDVAVEALHLHAPQRLGDRLRLGLARGLDALDDYMQAVPGAEA